MNKTKFKAWDKSTKKWLLEFLIDSRTGQVAQVPRAWKGSEDPDDFEVVEFTRFYDKQNQDLYFGDIVEAEIGQSNSPRYFGSNQRTLKYIMVVVKLNGCYAFENKTPKRPKSYNPTFIFFSSERIEKAFVSDPDKIENVRKIGNIYENPELLKTESEETK